MVLNPIEMMAKEISKADILQDKLNSQTPFQTAGREESRRLRRRELHSRSILSQVHLSELQALGGWRRQERLRQTCLPQVHLLEI